MKRRRPISARLRKRLRSTAIFALLFFSFIALTPHVQAQTWPERNVKVVVPFPAGGPADVMGRVIARHLGEKLGQSFIVENAAGANGNVGAASVANAAPDGYTLLFTTTGPLVFNKIIYKATTKFDPATDFTPIVEVSKIPLIVAANPGIPAKTFEDLVAYAKANPGKVTFGSSGVGSMGHLTAELFQQKLGFKITHVPYRGSAPAMNDLIGGQINLTVDLAATYADQVKAGTLRALATTDLKRWPLLPDTPVLAELGLPGFEATGWTAVVGPAKLPAEIVNKVNKTVNDYIASDEGKQALAKLGMVPAGGTPEALGKYMASELEKWRPVAEKVSPE
jgi:tripartite-type tricarboxylate transporter receptor subunit TctC